jgi:hypothetical protein
MIRRSTRIGPAECEGAPRPHRPTRQEFLSASERAVIHPKYGGTHYFTRQRNEPIPLDGVIVADSETVRFLGVFQDGVESFKRVDPSATDHRAQSNSSNLATVCGIHGVRDHHSLDRVRAGQSKWFHGFRAQFR